MILSAQSIRKRRGLIEPFHERTQIFGMSYGLSGAGYDIRIAQTTTVAAGRAVLASSMERFSMPNDLLARVTDKSTWARRFIAVQNTVIEPGWHGFLTLEISNHGRDWVVIDEGSPIAQIIFEKLDEPTEQPYSGKYQDQESGPQPARFT